jgi:hypothetical protein
LRSIFRETFTAYTSAAETKRGTRYMLYNGNDYGKTGIGLAVLRED